MNVAFIDISNCSGSVAFNFWLKGMAVECGSTSRPRNRTLIDTAAEDSSSRILVALNLNLILSFHTFTCKLKNDLGRVWQ